MIKDLTIIREHLVGYAEVEMPYDFVNDCPIHYITCSIDSDGNVSNESFYPDFKFKSRCNDILIVEDKAFTKRVPICRRNKGGDIIYHSRFFIPETIEDNVAMVAMVGGGKSKQESEDKISYQQEIIEKLIERVKEVEIQKHELSETISTYEDLLQEGRYKLKELSLSNREQKDKLDHYEELIPKLYNSR
jgi:hypothetical protein